MQCKDIPDAPILEFLWNVNQTGSWGNWYFEDERDVRRSMPLGLETPRNLVLAKMRQLIRRKLIDGCDCGCRGDYVVTLKGCDMIGRDKHDRFIGDEAV